ncbi:family 20 glycosylhydrolase [Galbibacter pacificus]|uniref:beta-N-acetylhexosaminidase n=1 Tax=Galbibacter pacificus TaxID=2996052 RepID=A0ABT6FQ41_9FLAO|nr:family 20 glycosylhydrolase [Galbibacter pacificus]MDG3582320.1 family 20 glycosylhydrolase [Galbibacter pacificus]MDG3585204.1 family 20 glycosylhydrolase [Galbibacter pacificus]
MKNTYLLLFFLCINFTLLAQDTLPLRGLAIAAPQHKSVDRFVKFIEEEVAPRKVNTMVLRVDYNFIYQSHPELAEKDGLTQADVDKIVEACVKSGIKIIPQINLLGHQSWAESLGKLLEIYPEFDETPQIEMPKEYEWPNKDGLYCKSYCPLHPKVHKVVFDLVDEITAAFKADAFHAGMDEVFYIADPNCPRCGGRDKAELYAGEVTKIRNHLAASGKRLWIWGDRLIDGKTTGMGMWEASMNNTYRAINLIPKDVMICDWHYERADPTASYFAMHGFDVATCSWRKPEVAKTQQQMLKDLRSNATDEMKDRYKGMLHTVWTSAENFMDMFEDNKNEEVNEATTFKAIF